MTTVVDSLEATYELYCEYAHACGFSVRKGKQYYVKGTNIIRSKVFFCSKQGIKKFKSEVQSCNEKLETRTSCKALVQFEVGPNKKWKVIKLVNDHNHEMARSYEMHLLRSARRATQAQGDTLESLVSSGIKTSQAFLTCQKREAVLEALVFLKGMHIMNSTVEEILLLKKGILKVL
jgi:hypothetical protein